MSPLAGGTAVVTGAGSGLGAAMAAAFAAEGMRIVALDINREAAESTAQQLEAAGTEALGCSVDVADRGALDAVAADVAERFGTCNVVAANVGVMQFGPLEHITADDWQWLLSVNVVGGSALAQHEVLAAWPGKCITQPARPVAASATKKMPSFINLWRNESQDCERSNRP